MVQSIEILVAEETTIKVDGKKFYVGKPKTVSVNKGKRLEILYNETQILPDIQQELERFARTIGIKPLITAKEEVCVPRYTDLFVAQIPEDYKIRIKKN